MVKDKKNKKEKARKEPQIQTTFAGRQMRKFY